MNTANISDLEKYILELEKQSADVEPLCKSKSKKDAPVDTNVVNKDSSNLSGQPMKEKKPRAPKTQKQLDAFKLTLEKRKNAVEQRGLNKKIESAKLLLATEMKKQPVPDKQTKPSKIISDKDYSSDSSSEEEIVVKKKKKSKKIVIVESSDSSSSSSSESEKEQPMKKKDFGRTHQNKKSVVKVHQPDSSTVKHKSTPSIPTKRNFFCD